jgi:hypothetical protein
MAVIRRVDREVMKTVLLDSIRVLLLGAILIIVGAFVEAVL